MPMQSLGKVIQTIIQKADELTDDAAFDDRNTKANGNEAKNRI